MADIITTISESITIGGATFSQSADKTYSDINGYRKHIVKIPAGFWTEVYRTDADANPSPNFHYQEVKYARLTNLDTSNYTFVEVKNTSSSLTSGCFYFYLPPGASFILQDHFEVIDNDDSLRHIFKVSCGQATNIIDVEAIVLTEQSDTSG